MRGGESMEGWVGKRIETMLSPFLNHLSFSGVFLATCEKAGRAKSGMSAMVEAVDVSPQRGLTLKKLHRSCQLIKV